MRTGPTNPELKELINNLKILSIEKKQPLWKRTAKELEKPSRIRREVNLWKINLNSKKDENVLVPGKVLSTGDLDHKVTIIAQSFSKKALEKIKKSGSNAITLEEYIKKNPTSKNIKIIG